MKKMICVLLVLAIGIMLCACGDESGSEATGSNENSGEVVEIGGGKVTVIQEIANAREAANCLSGSYFLLADDGSVITIGDDSDEDFAEIYAKMPNVKKLSLTNVGSAVVALTDEGDLYYQNNKIGSNVKEVEYCTTNMNVEGLCLMGSEVMWITSDDVLHQYSRNGDFKHIQTKEAINGELMSMEVDKHDFAVVNENGEVFMHYGGSSDAYATLDFSNFKGMAFVDIAKVMEDGEVKSLTVAGLKADGTTVAVGTYAQDVLSWGKLASLSMSDGMIVGLTTAGTLKMTGDYAEKMVSVVEKWNNIVAVKVGNAQVNNVGSLVTAKDKDGNFYYASLTDPRSSVDSGKISVNGGATGDRFCYKYAPNGTTYFSDNGGWEAE